MEACVGSHFLSRELTARGHEARLMPAVYVRPFLKAQRNDFRDAEAIAEAVQRPTMRFVPTKTIEQLDRPARASGSLEASPRRATIRKLLIDIKDGRIETALAFWISGGSHMPLWRLVPLDLDDPNWEASSHRAPVIVRAPNEESARDEAQRVFGVRTRFSPGTGVKFPPWKRASLVAAEQVDMERYDPDGPTEVLEPTFEQLPK